MEHPEKLAVLGLLGIKSAKAGNVSTLIAAETGLFSTWQKEKFSLPLPVLYPWPLPEGKLLLSGPKGEPVIWEKFVGKNRLILITIPLGLCTETPRAKALLQDAIEKMISPQVSATLRYQPEEEIYVAKIMNQCGQIDLIITDRRSEISHLRQIAGEWAYTAGWTKKVGETITPVRATITLGGLTAGRQYHVTDQITGQKLGSVTVDVQGTAKIQTEVKLGRRLRLKPT
jgi:hypothetical protein